MFGLGSVGDDNPASIALYSHNTDRLIVVILPNAALNGASDLACPEHILAKRRMTAKGF